jgi:hypothetical protein
MFRVEVDSDHSRARSGRDASLPEIQTLHHCGPRRMEVGMLTGRASSSWAAACIATM